MLASMNKLVTDSCMHSSQCPLLLEFTFAHMLSLRLISNYILSSNQSPLYLEAMDMSILTFHMVLIFSW